MLSTGRIERKRRAPKPNSTAATNPSSGCFALPTNMIGWLRASKIGDRHCFARNRWPDEPSSLESFGEQACPLAIVPDNLHKIASATAEHEQITAERVLAQHLLHLECQRRKASAHVRVACRQPHSRARRTGITGEPEHRERDVARLHQRRHRPGRGARYQDQSR